MSSTTIAVATTITTTASATSTALHTRLSSRTKTLTTPTAGLAPTHLQANLLVLPSKHARAFRALCHRNPVPCPLLAESAVPGSFSALASHLPGLSGAAIAADIDIRRDAPRYNVYVDGVLAKGQVTDIVDEWTEDHVAFLIGCSYSFESALGRAGLSVRHVVTGRNVPMYRTNIPLCPSGVFTGSTYVVSMRPYRRRDVEGVRDVTRAYEATHGEPIAWGWEAVERLGIRDLGAPDWGESAVFEDGRPFVRGEGRAECDEDEEVPVFWGCGVTPQEAVMRAGLSGTVMGHAPGHMIVLDVREEEILGRM